MPDTTARNQKNLGASATGGTDVPPKVRLLLVDDDRLILATLGQGLRTAGYAVTAVDTAREALAAAERATFDLALLDIRMPGMSGIEAAHQLRDRHGIDSLFLTAYGDEATVAQAVKGGALGYLVKPVDLHQLVPAVEAALARARDLKALQGVRLQLEHALAGGRFVSVAIGLLMERQRLGHDAAFQLLRNDARKNSRRVEDLAQELVAAAETLNRLGDGKDK